MYCVEVNGVRSDKLGVMGKFIFEERENENHKIKYEYIKSNDYKPDIQNTMEYKTFIYLLNHKQIPEIIDIIPVNCGYCGCLIGEADQKDGFCIKHKNTIENLFDYFSFYW